MRHVTLRPAALWLVLSSLPALAAAAPAPARWTFDGDTPGSVPRGFRAAVGEWKVVADPDAPSGGQVLAQTARSSGRTFNVILATGTSAADVDLSVEMKALAGEIDQGGGLVWRARDHRNYYIARYNPLEDNYRLYKVVDGRRRQLQNADIPHSGGWHTLRVTMVGDHIRCFRDGKVYLDIHDGTFTGPGMVGLWTKADARSHFDDLRLRVPSPKAPPLDPKVIEAVSGARATRAAGGVVRIGWPRTDVKVHVDGMPLRPFAGLGSWAAFAPAGDGAMVMGDTVVFEDEVDAAIDAVLASGLEITALHNHFLHEEPRVFFMHIGGRGKAEDLARGVKRVWAAIRSVRARSPAPAARFGGGVPAAGTLDREAIESTVGKKGKLEDGVVKISIGRRARMGGLRFGGSMGLTTWAAFSGSDELAAIDGDFAMTAAEVQPVLRALRRSGIHVVALHNHMIGERPAYFFTHFWGKGPARELARAFRAALDAQGAAKRKRGRR